MTARDEAIDAMGAREQAHEQDPFPDPYYGDLLDAIPSDVLTRLVAERAPREDEATRKARRLMEHLRGKHPRWTDVRVEDVAAALQSAGLIR